jgi:hypothetical protein
MAVVNVSTLSAATTPKSASVSMHTSATPAAIAGRAIGSTALRNAAARPRPSDCAASRPRDPAVSKATRASMYT